MKSALFPLACAFFLSACSQSPDVEEEGEGPVAQAPAAKVESPPSPQVGPNSPEEQAVASASTQDTIPARFHGKWAQGAENCDIPGHQQYRIAANQVGFFESRGIVETVRVDGDYAAATLSEQYGDAPPTVYVFYMAREGEDAMRLRYDKNDRFSVVRCPVD